MSTPSLIDENNLKRASFYDGLFDCPVCFQIFTNPIKQAPCGHRFCGKCLELILK